jgi:hypothetical protein
MIQSVSKIFLPAFLAFGVGRHKYVCYAQYFKILYDLMRISSPHLTCIKNWSYKTRTHFWNTSISWDVTPCSLIEVYTDASEERTELSISMEE